MPIQLNANGNPVEVVEFEITEDLLNKKIARLNINKLELQARITEVDAKIAEYQAKIVEIQAL